MSYDFLQWLDEKVLEYISGKSKRTGKDINFRCPICGDSKKSASKMRGHYYLHTHSFYCFNCDTALSGLKLLEHLSGNEYSNLKTEYLKLKYKDNKLLSGNNLLKFENYPDSFSFNKLVNIIDENWKTSLSAKAINYLNDRFIFDAPYAQNLKLYSTYDKKDREFILIPWIVNGISAYFQLNDFEKHGDKKYIFPPNKDKLIFGLDNIDISFPYIICFEGVYDSVFVKNGVAIGGKKLTVLQRVILKKRYPNHQIVLALDNDLAGKTAMLNQMKDDPSIKYLIWYKDIKQKIKDVNDYMKMTYDFTKFTDEEYLKSCMLNNVIIKYMLANEGIKH